MPEIQDQAATLRAAAALRNGAGKEANGGTMPESPDPAEQPASQGEALDKARPFDFNQPPRHNKTQLRSLKLLHDNFCSPLAKTLTALSGLPCQVKLESLASERFAAADSRIYGSAASAGGKLLLSLSRPSAWLILERLLGGGTAGAAQDRPHSEIEKNVLAQLLMKPVLACYCETWSRIAPVQFTFEQFADDAHSVPGFSPAAETVAAVFSMKLGTADGELAAIMPFSFLKPLMPGLDMTKILGSGKGPERTAAKDEALLAIPVNLRAFFGRIDIKLKDLNSLAKGDVLRLDTRPEDEVTVEVEGTPRFAAKTGRIGNGLGVQIVRQLDNVKRKDGEKNANTK